MSYSVYVNETYIDDLANSDLWQEFLEWGDSVDFDKYPKLVTLAIHGYISKPAELRAELQAIKKAKEVPSDLGPIVNRLIAASKQLNGESDDESILFVTDGTDGLIDAVIPADDPDHIDDGDGSSSDDDADGPAAQTE